MSAMNVRSPRLVAAMAAMGADRNGSKGKAPGDRSICGALSKRSGRPCQVSILYPNGRCHMHGGPSTGPKTEAGKATQLANLARFNEKRRQERQQRKREEQAAMRSGYLGSQSEPKCDAKRSSPAMGSDSTISKVEGSGDRQSSTSDYRPRLYRPRYAIT